MTSLNTAGKKIVDLPDFEAPAIRQAPDGVELFPITADGRLTMEIRGGLLKNDRIIVSCTAEPGSHKDASYMSVSLPVTTDGRRVVNLPLSIIAFSLGQTITFRYEVERGGERKDSASLILNVLPIPPERLPMPRALDADEGGVGEVWDLTEGTHDRTIRLDTWPLIAPGQLVSLGLRGKTVDGWETGADILLPDKDNAEPWGNNAYRDVRVRFSALKNLREGGPVTLAFKVNFNQIRDSLRQVSFPLRIYTVKAYEWRVPKIVSVTDSKGFLIPDGGSTTDPWLRMTVEGEPNELFDIFEGANFLTGSNFNEDGTWSDQLSVRISVGEHSIRAVGDYGNKPESNTWTFTVEPPSKN